MYGGLFIILQGLIKKKIFAGFMILPSISLLHSKYQLIHYTRGIHEFFISFFLTIYFIFLIILEFSFLLVQNLGGSHPIHATIQSWKARQRHQASHELIKCHFIKSIAWKWKGWKLLGNIKEDEKIIQ